MATDTPYLPRWEFDLRAALGDEGELAQGRLAQ